jgi:antitoxin MazE
METSLVKIGNSQGIIIPRRLLNKLGRAKRFSVEEKDGSLIFMPVHEEKPRENWDELFANALKNESKQNEDPFDSVTNDFDQTEWTW